MTHAAKVEVWHYVLERAQVAGKFQEHETIHALSDPGDPNLILEQTDEDGVLRRYALKTSDCDSQVAVWREIV